MRLIIKIVFGLAFLVLNIFLLMPMGNRGVSWTEAGLAIVPAGLVSLICFLLLMAGVGAKDRSRSGAARWWAAALLWSVLVGGIVTFVTTNSYQDNMRTAMDDLTSRSSRRYGTSLEEAYAKQDQIGIIYGWTTLGFAGLSLLGLIVSIVMAKKSPTAPPEPAASGTT